MGMNWGRRAIAPIVSLLGVVTLGAGTLALAQDESPQPSAGTDPIALAALAYSRNCATCHGPSLDGTASAGALRGEKFYTNWGGGNAAQLDGFIRAAMPPANAGGLSEADYAGILEHLLRINGTQFEGQLAGASEETLRAITIADNGDAISDEEQERLIALTADDGGFGASARYPIPPAPERPDRFADYNPVTVAELANPAPENWLTWRRSHYGLGFSPLDQIDSANVGDLRLIWSVALPNGANMNEPLVRDGVLYTFGFGDEVWAMDAADGHVLWRYQRDLPRGTPVSSKKTLAMYGNKIFAATSDLHMVALDARTGEVAWDSVVTDNPAVRNPGGPMVADGVVMTGVTGSVPGGNFITGFDSETGEKLWTFHLVAQPGGPGGDTWNGLALEERSGGSSWVSGNYDPETGVALWGSGPTYDTGPLRDRKPGMNNDALYTNATVALVPRTGELRWYYQHMENDQWDLDWVFDRVVARLEVDGEDKRVIMTAGKLGLFDVLDAESGDYIKTIDMGIQDLVTAVDPETGYKTTDPAKLPGGENTETIYMCPHGGGGRNWGATAFNQDSNRLFVVARDMCMDLRPVTGSGFLSTGVAVDYAPRHGSDGKYGLMQALDMQTGEIKWSVRQRATFDTSILATAGGVLFAGSMDRQVKAWDQESGEELWSAGLAGVPNGGPVSFAVDGRQYVAFVTGYGNPLSTGVTELSPDVALPLVNSSAVYVFALPEVAD
jgi:alcohol dehydrogenase (cytochrome c)